jgi:hypothetical protein
MTDSVKRLVMLFSAVFIAPAVLACGDSAEPERAASETDGPVPIVRVEGRYATSLARDAETLLSAMGSYFVGQVVEEGFQRQQTADAGSGRAVPITVFKVQVERSPGSPVQGSLIDVEQFGGLTTGAAGAVRILLENDTPMAAGARYLFFAKEVRPGVYSASAFARFPLDGERISAPPGWEATGASTELAGLTLDEAFDRLGAE